ncbi:tRNA 2-thiouridine(34) synthase MnmA [Candidatus Nomurabacteria bacterium RIFCSPLOWO2_02_FULL_44_12]|uniref:tRNA-specific 2-thiouridylase MnmA n=1 Tax=Candidatus Nomurabacteria bacterium RIFCSPLOWO2_12_FULL_44_11 TaxID=1801796 RepID=A0A1F6Y4T6_9BACT|nr:MAG: tRNA 2-thiouridine(34) synthase MnmA [Candidatus Nomurabacteria bacterium RIFCSPHIGHO2_12_FULL_44_22b]OGJ01384.1 MAG: tRNA 2-thiouridine(34) synthase MnmA [Candidatus Nomurabacteria bacterium RIFCSPLOWO2_12_FULL_44_11]OGJ07336.1 MAG: tRNA 2-thiouridine(34) synthase MnmA [Candidatus Nomurabacteria bacterium RIFCSPLOWO2_02_FULL_44_12]
MNRKQTVFIGLSGGVDSAVSAALLKKQGFDVVGVFIKTWHPDFLECNEEKEKRDAMRITAHLDIPFLTFNLEKVYKKEVGDYMIREYRAGRTPNPDVMCNKEVKFGAFLKKAISMGADYIATGHYARNSLTENFLAFLHPSGGTFRRRNFPQGNLLLRGKDPSKDQSYFLWTFTQKQLSKIIFPVGNLKKTEVRKLAKKFKLPVAEKKDSQGICFLGAVDLKEFLKHYIKTKKGKVVNKKGEIIGWHNGVVFYTLGERHGFIITKKGPNDNKYYVVDKDIKKNILIVSHNRVPVNSNVLMNFKIKNTNWINETPSENKKYTAQIRYHGELLPCQVKNNVVMFSQPVLVAPGQSCVIYDGEVCLGGGVII